MQKQSALGSGRVSLWSDILLRLRALINLEIPCITRRLVSTAAGESGRLTWLDNAASFSIVLYGANNIESRKLNSIEIKPGFSCELKNQIRVFMWTRSQSYWITKIKFRFSCELGANHIESQKSNSGFHVYWEPIIFNHENQIRVFMWTQKIKFEKSNSGFLWNMIGSFFFLFSQLYVIRRRWWSRW